LMASRLSSSPAAPFTPASACASTSISALSPSCNPHLGLLSSASKECQYPERHLQPHTAAAARLDGPATEIFDQDAAAAAHSEDVLHRYGASPGALLHNAPERPHDLLRIRATPLLRTAPRFSPKPSRARTCSRHVAGSEGVA
jgi:hypothetical protein